MTEQLIRESAAEKERLRDRITDLERIGNVEKSLAVQQTKFDALEEHAVTRDDLKDLKHELEDDVNKQLTHVCDHMTGQNDRQSGDILNKVEGMFTRLEMRFTNEQLAQKNEQLAAISRMRTQIIWWGLGALGTILTSVISALIIMRMSG